MPGYPPIPSVNCGPQNYGANPHADPSLLDIEGLRRSDGEHVILRGLLSYGIHWQFWQRDWLN